MATAFPVSVFSVTEKSETNDSSLASTLHINGVDINGLSREVISIETYFIGTAGTTGITIDRSSADVAFTVNQEGAGGSFTVQISGTTIMEANASGVVTVGQSTSTAAFVPPIYTAAGDPTAGFLAPTGALLWNSGDDKLYVYDGAAWKATAALT